MKLSISNKEIWQITYPIIFGNLAQTIMVLINTIFLGHVGTVELGAVMMAGTFYLVFTTITNGFAVGVQIMVARRFGEGQPTKIGELFEHGLAFALLLGGGHQVRIDLRQRGDAPQRQKRGNHQCKQFLHVSFPPVC